MTDEQGLTPVAGPSEELAPAADEVAFQDAFLRLFERRVMVHTMGDSSSVPAGFDILNCRMRLSRSRCAAS